MRPRNYSSQKRWRTWTSLRSKSKNKTKIEALEKALSNPIEDYLGLATSWLTKRFLTKILPGLRRI